MRVEVDKAIFEKREGKNLELRIKFNKDIKVKAIEVKKS